MSEENEAELEVALAAGLISQEEVEALRAEALRLERGPLALLAAQGRISEETLAALRTQGASTLQPGAAGPERRTGEPAFPVLSWERYQPVRFLGQGGMGRVFLAYDMRLRRNVALKFVRDDEPALVRRFVAEAQAQARVDHEHVCKVYEVGEVQGRPYIAMQYVDGRPLQALAGELTLEQKVVLLAQAAEGVHAAHRAGLIHRDLKPSNILVERTPEGRLKPYVMDFGLARDWKEESTATGTVLGTPHFMAPEQARGEVSRLDRRADVYSLGATLYFLLTQQPPFPGRNNLEVINHLATQELRPPRALNREIPVDLEAILLKCLEKERSARYDSARELIEELRRFLDGEPVWARTASVGYRLRKYVRKHWRAVSVAAVVLGVVLMAGVQIALARREADLRERVARRFTEQAEGVEARARYMALSPLHDVRAERQALRTRLEALDAEVRQGGEPVRGPGHYALGRGWLALGEPARAREHLEASWQHGFHEPRAAYTLALALSQLYRQQLVEAELLPTEPRQRRRRELVDRYRARALDWLRKGESAALPSSGYVAALLAFLEEREEEALARVDTLGGQFPWFFEAPMLRGDILLARASREWDKGHREQTRADLEAARQAYAQAAAIGESVPETHQALARTELVALRMELYGPGEVLPHVTRAQEALSRAIAAAPDHIISRRMEARVYRRLAEYRTQQGGEVEEVLQKAIEAARHDLTLEPGSWEGLQELALAFWQWGRYRQERNQDPREQLRQAIETFEAVRSTERNSYFHTQLGLIFKVWADYEDQIGVDSLPHRDRAIAAYRDALALNEQMPEAWINLGIAWFKRASHPKAPDVKGDAERARQALEKARTLSPQNVVPHFYEGQLHELLARQLRNHGGDARLALEEALAAYQRGLALNSKLPQLHNGVGLTRMEQAREASDRGEDPLPLLAQAQAAFEQAVAVAPKQGLAHNNLAEVHLERAVVLSSRGADPRPSVRAALDALSSSLQRLPGHALPWANRGRAHQLLAKFELEHQRDPGSHLAEAEEALRQSLERNPKSAEAWLFLGETRGVRARWQAGRGRGRDADFEKAAEAYEQALTLTTRPVEYRLAQGRLYREWASWRRQTGQDPGPLLQRGGALTVPPASAP